MTAQQFVDDDDGYLAWKSAHPHGVILNCERSPRAAYLMLHSASCRTLADLQPGYSHWTAQYIKVCSDSKPEIEAWVQAKVPDGSPIDCQACLDPPG